MIQPRRNSCGTEMPRARRRIPDLRPVVHARERVLDFAAAGREHLAVGQHGRADPAAQRRHRLRLRDRGRRAVDVDDGRAVRVAAHLENLAGAEHRCTRGPARVRRLQLTRRRHRAGAARVDVVHSSGRVVAENTAVRGQEVTRERGVEAARPGRREQPERAIALTHFGEIAAAAPALNVDVAVHEHGGRRIPARAIHVAGARERVAERVEDVAVVVAGVRRTGARPVVAARDQDLAALRQDDLRAAKDVRERHVVEREVPRAQACRRLPDVVDEVARLLARAVRAVGKNAAVGRERGVDADQRPTHDGRPDAVQLRLRRRGCREADGGGEHPEGRKNIPARGKSRRERIESVGHVGKPRKSQAVVLVLVIRRPGRCGCAVPRHASQARHREMQERHQTSILYFKYRVTIGLLRYIIQKCKSARRSLRRRAPLSLARVRATAGWRGAGCLAQLKDLLRKRVKAESATTKSLKPKRS